MFEMGVRCYFGRDGQTVDKAAAARWFTKSADKGSVSAQANLGSLYLRGEGVDKNVETAMSWLTKAAEQGSATAMYSLGGMYDRGDGVPADQKKAIEWYRKAMAKGSERAKLRLRAIENPTSPGTPAAAPKEPAPERLTEQGPVG